MEIDLTTMIQLITIILLWLDLKREIRKVSEAVCDEKIREYDLARLDKA